MSESFQYKPFDSAELCLVTRERFIAKGGYGKVYLCKQSVPGIKNDIQLAAKFTDDSSSVDINYYSLLGKLNHPNVVKYYGTAVQIRLEERTIIIVSEYCNGKSKTPER